MIKKLLFFIINLILLKTKTVNNECKDVKGVGSPGNIIHKYFHQIYDAINNDKIKKPFSIVSISKRIKDKIHYKFIFRLTDFKRTYYIGIISEIKAEELFKKNPKHFITNFIQSPSFIDIQKTLNIYSVSPNYEVHCSFDLKAEFWNYVHTHPILDNGTNKLKKNKKKIKKIHLKNHQKKEGGLSKTQEFLNKLKNLHLLNKFKGTHNNSVVKFIYKRKNQYKLGDVLSGSGKNKIMNPVKVKVLEMKNRKKVVKHEVLQEDKEINTLDENTGDLLKKIAELQKKIHS